MPANMTDRSAWWPAFLRCSELAARGADLPFGIDVLAFGDEEGSRFRTTLAGSSACAGVFDRASLAFPDRNGVTLGDAIKAYGKSVDDIATAAYDPADVVGYVEVHIEQGPVLEAAEPAARRRHRHRRTEPHARGGAGRRRSCRHGADAHAP